VELSLDLDPFIQHGHVIEVTGKTEGGARVMVNGREVPIVADDGSFHYFTPPLPNGQSLITVTAQNSKGGVNTRQAKVVIQ
jgi:glucodextranase-like protein